MSVDPGLALLVLVIGIVAGACGWILALSRHGRRQGLSKSLEPAGTRADILEILPDLVRQMLTSPSRRGINLQALKLVDQLLHPEQSVIFVARPTQRRLALVAGNGLASSLSTGLEVEYGQGPVGHVAESRMVMDAADFDHAGVLSGRPLEESPLKGLRADVVAPIEDDGGLIGVLCVGGARTHLGLEKQALRMVAGLTAVAMAQMRRLRATEEAANFDGLTEVYTKQYFQQRLEHELRRAEREKAPLSLLFLDLDHFKHYNDTNGHLAGDEVLKKVGQLLKGSIREDDVVARYGGEEFIILYRGAPKEVALRLAEGLRRAVESYPFAHRNGQPLGTITISGGVATFPEDSPDGLEVVRFADQALYEAKAKGRNQMVAARRPAESPRS